MVLSGVIYHEGEQSHCGHYTSGVKVYTTWFLKIDIENYNVAQRISAFPTY